MVNTLFSGNKIPKVGNRYICFAAVGIDCILKVDIQNYPQVNLQQIKHKIKRRKTVNFTDAELDLSSNDSDD